MSTTSQILYRGSVKDVRGPVAARIGGTTLPDSVVFEYTDAYSVFDWGKMPDSLPKKGEALAILAADWFERLDKAETWKEFSRSSEAMGLRKGNRFGGIFNEIGEDLQARGLSTHYLGALPQAHADGGSEALPVRLQDLQAPTRHLVVQRVSVVKPVLASVLGRTLPDYHGPRTAPAPRIVPLEVVFRFSLPEGSSLLERVARDPGYLASLGFPDAKPQAGSKWDFPILELFTKLEASDRPVSLIEALSISGVSAAQLQEILFRTAWVAAALKWMCAKAKIELADGKLEWGIDAAGNPFLIDAIGPDELRLLKDGVQLSKEFLRAHYRTTPWNETVTKAKEVAKAQGSNEWKKFVPLPPPTLPAPKRELASQLYQSLTNLLTGREWFAGAWPIDRVVSELRAAQQQQQPGATGQG